MPYLNGTFIGPTQINYDQYDPTNINYRPENPNYDPDRDTRIPITTNYLEEVAPGVRVGVRDHPGFNTYQQPDFYKPEITPSMWDEFQANFTKQMSSMMPTGVDKDEEGNQIYDPNGVGANVLLQTTLGGGFVIPDMNSNASAILTPGALKIQTDEHNNVSIGPSGLGISHSPNKGVTKFTGNFNPGYGGNNVSGEINFEHNVLPPVAVPANVPMSGSELGIGPVGVRAPDPLLEEQVLDNQLSKGQQFLKDYLKASHGTVDGMGVF